MRTSNLVARWGTVPRSPLRRRLLGLLGAENPAERTAHLAALDALLAAVESAVAHLESALVSLQDAVHRRSPLDDQPNDTLLRRTGHEPDARDEGGGRVSR